MATARFPACYFNRVDHERERTMQLQQRLRAKQLEMQQQIYDESIEEAKSQYEDAKEHLKSAMWMLRELMETLPTGP